MTRVKISALLPRMNRRTTFSEYVFYGAVGVGGAIFLALCLCDKVHFN